MRVSGRLQKIAHMVKYSSVADIGTDHGYLPIFLMQNGLAERALAADVNPGPLESAQRNINEAGLGGPITTRLCNGLDCIDPADYEACVISGMGGGLIIDILRQNLEVAQSFKQLLLSPQRDVPDVRRFLHQHGFCINDEYMLEEKGKMYNILDVSPGVEPEYDGAGYAFGAILINKKSEILRKYINIELNKAKKIEQHKFERYIQLCEEVLKCL